MRSTPRLVIVDGRLISTHSHSEARKATQLGPGRRPGGQRRGPSLRKEMELLTGWPDETRAGVAFPAHMERSLGTSREILRTCDLLPPLWALTVRNSRMRILDSKRSRCTSPSVSIGFR
jgi:hypothetical protein